MKTRLIQRFAIVSAVALISLSGTAALAQPGPHGAHGGDFAFGIAHLKSQLNLNTSQQTMFDNAVAQSKAARDTARANFQRIRDAMNAELAKPEPDLAAVAAVSDDVQAANIALRRQVRGTWLALYATFTPEQKAVVKNAIQQRTARMQALREKWQQRHGQ
jgi:Spy/CpxP family protein refolding chaperone